MTSCALISPAYHPPDKYEKIFIKNLKDLGFNEIIDLTSKESFFNKWGGTPKERLSLFYKAFESKASAIISYRGGSGVFHFISDIDFSRLKKNKKPIIGYSDLTPLLNLIHEKTGMITFHGPMVKSLSSKINRSALQKALSMQTYGISFTKKENKIFNAPGKNIYGKIVGGNLNRIIDFAQLSELNCKNKILFLEDVHMTKYQTFNFLVLLKKFKNFKPKAILLGDFEFKNTNSFQNMVKYLFPDTPIIMGLPFGHTLPNITIPIGANCLIDFNKKKIKFSFPKKAKKYAVKF